MTQIKQQTTEKTVNITITLPEGYSSAKYDKETQSVCFIKDEYTVFDFKRALESKKGETVYYMSSDSDIQSLQLGHDDIADADTYANSICSYDEAVAFRALMQLRLMRNAYVRDWKPDDDKIVYYISMPDFEVCSTVKRICLGLFTFPTKDSATEFVKCNRGLFDKIKVLFE